MVRGQSVSPAASITERARGGVTRGLLIALTFHVTEEHPHRMRDYCFVAPCFLGGLGKLVCPTASAATRASCCLPTPRTTNPKDKLRAALVTPLRANDRGRHFQDKRKRRARSCAAIHATARSLFYGLCHQLEATIGSFHTDGFVSGEHI